MYQSIDDLGNLFQRQQEAKELRQQYQDYYRAFQAKRKGKKSLKCLFLWACQVVIWWRRTNLM